MIRFVIAAIALVLAVLPVCADVITETAMMGMKEGKPRETGCPVGYLTGVSLWYDNSMSGLAPYCVVMTEDGSWKGSAQITNDLMSRPAGGTRLELLCPLDTYVFGYKGSSHVYGIHSIMQLTLVCRNVKTGALTSLATHAPTGVALTPWAGGQCPKYSAAVGFFGSTYNDSTIIQFGLKCSNTRPEGIALDLCRDYANTAVQQNAENGALGCGFTDARWNSNKADHQTWCMTVGPASAASHTDARKADLDTCRAEVRARGEVVQKPGGAVGDLIKPVDPLDKLGVVQKPQEGIGQVLKQKTP